MIKCTEREAVMELRVKCWVLITRDIRVVIVTRAIAKIRSNYSDRLPLNIQWQFPKANRKSSPVCSATRIKS